MQQDRTLGMVRINFQVLSLSFGTILAIDAISEQELNWELE